MAANGVGMKESFEGMLELLDVRLDAFAICEIGARCGLKVEPLDKIVVHYVLQGEGSIEWDEGSIPIRTGTMIVIPRRFAKRINGPGPGPVLFVAEAKDTCPLTEGIVKFRACRDSGDLLLGCGSLTAAVGAGGSGLFDHLQQPLVERSADEMLPLMFNAILAELSRPGLGTKPIVEALMKQVLLLLLRGHLKRSGSGSPVALALVDPNLGRAIAAMVGAPERPHNLDSLAALAGMSRSRFTYHFGKTYGRSPMDYLQSIRLEAAARLLRSSAMPVKCVAAAAGFASRSHFSRAFRAEFGVDPSGYRERAAQPVATIAAQPAGAAAVA